MDDYTIECSCCLKEVSVDNFYTIDLKLSQDKIIRSAIIEEICKDCLSESDIFIPSLGNFFNYTIKNLQKYIDKRIENYLRLNYELTPEECMTMKECHDVLVAHKLLSDSYGKNSKRKKSVIEGDKIKRAKDLLFTKEKSNLIQIYDVPSNLGETFFKYLVEKKAFFNLVDQMLKGHFKGTSKQTISLEKFKKLEEEGWASMGEKNNKPFFYYYTDEENKMKPCRYCGEIKSFEDFRNLNYGNGQSNYRCLDCEASKAKAAYDNMTIEEKEGLLNSIREYNKNNREKRRSYEKKYRSKPEARAYNNVRNRLKKFLKKAKDHHFSKQVGCTRKELVEHLSSQFEQGMNWDNYGSGENNDHEGCWHIDHIIPISKFKGNYPNHYTNLQPMWGKQNLKKSNKVYEE